MEEIFFDEHNAVLNKPPGMTDEECKPLPVFRDKGRGVTISCWRMTWRDRLRAIFYGLIWVYVHSGGKTQPPIMLVSDKTVFE